MWRQTALECHMYISNPDNEATLRLYIPKHLKEAVVKEYHDNFHMRIDKAYASIRQNIIGLNYLKN